jgi:hypothetical protein
VLDADDNCPEVANADQLDTNQNGIGDACDTDADGDGVSDQEDTCPEVSDPEQTDTDDDGVGDACDDDDDGDGVTDIEDACPTTAAGSSEATGTGLGCDPWGDVDGDDPPAPPAADGDDPGGCRMHAGARTSAPNAALLLSLIGVAFLRRRRGSRPV